MTHYLQLILLSAAFIQGFEYATLTDYKEDGQLQKSGEILWFIRYYGVKILNKNLYKPLITCPICMSSVYGSAFFWFDHAIHPGITNSLTLITWVAFVVCLAGVNRVITKFIHS